MGIIAFLDTGVTVSLISERLSKKKLKGLNIWPFTGITSTIAYSIESAQVVAPTVSFLLRDANDVLIARFNPICLGQLLKNWVRATLFMGQYQLSWHRREIMVVGRNGNIWNAEAVKNMDWSGSKWVLLREWRIGNETRQNTNKDSRNQSAVLMSRVHSDGKGGARLFSGWFLQCRMQCSSTCVDPVHGLVWRKTFQKYLGKAEDDVWWTR